MSLKEADPISQFNKYLTAEMYTQDPFSRFNASDLEDDVLMPFVYRYLMITQLKAVRLCIYFLIAFSTTLVLVQSYEFLNQFDGRIFTQYGAFYFSIVYLTASLSMIIHLHNIWMPRLKLVRKCLLSDLIGLDADLRLQVKSQAQTRKSICAIHLSCLAIYMIIRVTVFSIERSNIFIVSLVLEKYVPPALSEAAHWLFCAVILTSTVFVIMPPYYILYSIFHLEFHLNILLSCLDCIRENLKVENDYPKMNKIYQENVKKNLVFVIKRHQEMIILSKEFIKLAGWTILIFTIAGVLMLLSVVFEIYADAYNWIEPSAGFIMCFGIAFYLCYHGQYCEDLGIKLLSKLEDLDWTKWNKDNVHIFLFTLMMARSPIMFHITPFLAANYDFFKQLIKISYSVLNILNSTRK